MKQSPFYFGQLSTVMNGYILIAGQQPHISHMNPVFVLQETSRNYLKAGMSPNMFERRYFCSLNCRMSNACTQMSHYAAGVAQ